MALVNFPNLLQFEHQPSMKIYNLFDLNQVDKAKYSLTLSEPSKMKPFLIFNKIMLKYKKSPINLPPIATM